ncbi:hypothetical protein MCAP1_003200 [Malassezia caprae]|uniref:Ketoreductase domain-containing protein n=1 Tax=Malassezia caprae TaxID=1381934 RepID=A0AAF0EAM2_9BASI|nr:hypothetical protein MCAP1_003200 [Malassezia caprae]
MDAATEKKCVLVTGGSRGIGLEIVRCLLTGTEVIPPSRVVSLSRSVPAELETLAQEYPSDLVVVQGDVTEETDAEKARDAALKRWGRIDALVLNAGIAELAPCADLTAERFLHVLNVNTVSLAVTVRLCLPELRKQHGTVVFVSSGAAVGNYAAWPSYNASKAAMNAYARTLANEERDIACFSVRPGVVDTDMQAQIRASEQMPAEAKAKFLALYKEGKLLPARKPAHVLAALAVRGSRTSPQLDTGSCPGADGTFVSWDDAASATLQAP